MPRAKPINPFYALLLVAGVLFVLTACGYSVLVVKGSHAGGSLAAASGESLLEWLDQHGFTALMVELSVLALATVGAITTDDYRTRKAAARRSCEDERQVADDVR